MSQDLMTPTVERVPTSRLRRICDPATLPFETTAEVENVLEVSDQTRALEALRFAMEMPGDCYNAFALGSPGLGKHDAVRRLLESEARRGATPPDWCYVHNFDEPHRPRALALPPGRGSGFKRDMERLVRELRAAIPAAFESEDYRSRRKLLEEDFKQRSQRAFEEIGKEAAQHHVAVIRTPVGLAVAPTREGQVLEPEEFERLPEAEREDFRVRMAASGERLQALLASLPQWEREHREKLRALDREITALAVGHLIDELKTDYADVRGISEQLEAVRQDVLAHAEELQQRAEAVEAPLPSMAGLSSASRSRSIASRYLVNLIVDRGGAIGAPVVCVDLPTHRELIGRIEHLSELGALVTDFRLIKAGALHRANGGYIVIDALKLLQQPFAWDSLKRALRWRQLRIESLGDVLGVVSTVSLDPEPIPLEVKVVLVGDRLLHHLLADLDPDFPDLFKVGAEFEEWIDRDAGGEVRYARLLGTLARRKELLALDRSAVARSIEHGSRLAGDAQKLSVQLEHLTDLLREADHFARKQAHPAVTAADIQQAIDAKIRRSDLLQRRYEEEIRRGTILIDLEGTKVGQVNGLSVVQLGGTSFGRPTRITARVRLGAGQLVDIEREVALGGAIHSKGVLILAGYLGMRYSSDRPLSLAASLVFEQSYGGVEGDSASSAELIALLSAIAEAPLRQSVAVTGSVNQLGQIQAVGGINEKIEGFFDVCRAQGLSGEQGVIIPAANVKHLMLRHDILEAAERGLFHVHPIATVDQGLEILAGAPAGERGAGGFFPAGTINRRIEDRLESLARKARAYSRALPAETTRIYA